eukprot:2302970-Amphidinium_carterae.1
MPWPGSGFSSFLWHLINVDLYMLLEPRIVVSAVFLRVERAVDAGTLLLITTSTTIPTGSPRTCLDMLAHREELPLPIHRSSNSTYNRSGTLLDTEEDVQFEYVWSCDLQYLGQFWKEFADIRVLPSFAPVSVSWRRRVRHNPSSYDPWTWYNCLFLSLTRELCDFDSGLSPCALRYSAKHLWSKGATVLGANHAANVDSWSKCYGTNPQDSLNQTTRRRWGSAPDAMILCKALNVNLLIIDDFRVLVRQTVKKNQRWVVLRLVNSHYTVANRQVIRPAAYEGRDVYTIFNRAGREVQISHFSQFAMALSGGDVKHGGTSVLHAPFRSFCFVRDVMLGVTSALLAPFLSCCPGRSKPEKRPTLLGEKKKCEEPYWPVGERSRKDPPPTPEASWRAEDPSRSVLLWGLGGCWCSLFTFIMGFLWCTTFTELWCGIAIDNTLVLEFVEFGSGRLFDLTWSSSWSSSCSSSSSLHLQFLLLGGMLQQVPQRAIHFDDPSDTQSFGMVQFQATTLKAPDYNENEFLPLLFFMSGLEGLGGIRDATVQALMSSKRWPAGSLILVAPLRKPTHWWFSANSKNWGWLEGELDVELVCNMGMLIEELARHPKVDPRKIVLYGFSAGAYAVTELLTTHQSALARVVVLGGVHGHGPWRHRGTMQDTWPAPKASVENGRV